MSTQQQVIILFYALLLGEAIAYVMERVSIHPKSGCWLWLGANDGRYGHAYYAGFRYKAHRLAWMIWRGSLPRRKVLDHHECDRTRCCNPYHLKCVTHSKNMKRCFAVGRGKSPFLKVAQ